MKFRSIPRKSIFTMMQTGFALIFFIIVSQTIAIGTAAAQLPADNFDDNVFGDMWSLVEDDSTNVWLEETNQRLEARATSETTEALATCVSNQWQLSTAQDFAMQIDWHHLSTARDAGLFS